jgi:hypothetical protein
MTVIAVAPIVLKDVDLKIGTDNYEAHVSSVILTPASASVKWKGLTPTATFTDTSNVEWTAQLDYAQDWVTVNSLSNYLFANQGTTKVAVFAPKKGSGLPNWTVSLVIAPGPIGGSVDTYMTGTVQLGVSGQPVKGVAA